jgi:hypothetical protein
MSIEAISSGGKIKRADLRFPPSRVAVRAGHHLIDITIAAVSALG